MTTKETLYLTLSNAKMQASKVRTAMLERAYTNAAVEIERLCDQLTQALLDNFTDEQACKLFDKLGL